VIRHRHAGSVRPTGVMPTCAPDRIWAPSGLTPGGRHGRLEIVCRRCGYRREKAAGSSESHQLFVRTGLCKDCRELLESMGELGLWVEDHGDQDDVCGPPGADGSTA